MKKLPETIKSERIGMQLARRIWLKHQRDWVRRPPMMPSGNDPRSPLFTG